MAQHAAGTPAATMKLVGGDPSLDFVNTVGGRLPAGTRVRDDKLRSYSDLVAFGLHTGLLGKVVGRYLLRLSRGRPRAARAALKRALAFREAYHRTLHALMRGRRPSSGDLQRLNLELLACRGHEALAPRGPGLGWEWQGSTTALEAPLWPVVRAVAALVTSSDVKHIRRCGSPGCGWLFLDRSRSRRRRWCSMEDCGNREKVRRFRRRHLA